MLPAMFGSLEVATIPGGGAPAAAHVVLPVGFPLFALIVVALLTFAAMRAIIGTISVALHSSKLDLLKAPAGSQLSKLQQSAEPKLAQRAQVSTLA